MYAQDYETEMDYTMHVKGLGFVFFHSKSMAFRTHQSPAPPSQLLHMETPLGGPHWPGAGPYKEDEQLLV